MKGLSVSPTAVKIAKLLTHDRKDFGEGIVSFPGGYEELAGLAGVQPDTAYRALRSLEGLGALKFLLIANDWPDQPPQLAVKFDDSHWLYAAVWQRGDLS